VKKKDRPAASACAHVNGMNGELMLAIVALKLVIRPPSRQILQKTIPSAFDGANVAGVGAGVGCAVGATVGADVGAAVGTGVGESVGRDVGTAVGTVVCE
jgi:hypothetical protein